MKIPEICLELKIEKKNRFKWAPKDVGGRSKIGGIADFVQDKIEPSCNCCKKKMIFYAQLDSISDDFMIADCGLIYIFICFDCNNTESFIQSY